MEGHRLSVKIRLPSASGDRPCSALNPLGIVGVAPCERG